MEVIFRHSFWSPIIDGEIDEPSISCEKIMHASIGTLMEIQFKKLAGKIQEWEKKI